MKFAQQYETFALDLKYDKIDVKPQSPIFARKILFSGHFIGWMSNFVDHIKKFDRNNCSKGSSPIKKTVKKRTLSARGGGVNPSSLIKLKFTGFSNRPEMDSRHHNMNAMPQGWLGLGTPQGVFFNWDPPKSSQCLLISKF